MSQKIFKNDKMGIITELSFIQLLYVKVHIADEYRLAGGIKNLRVPQHPDGKLPFICPFKIKINKIKWKREEKTLLLPSSKENIG